jgi:MFS family permease
VYGLGMGMIFVPLFDIIMGEVRDHEIGSASSLLESVQQLGASLGVAVLGTIFFTVVHTSTFAAASHRVALVALGLTALAFGLCFRLPRHTRHAPVTADDKATDDKATDDTAAQLPALV